MYIEPDPGGSGQQAGATTPPAAQAPSPSPGWLGTLWRSMSTIPAHQPILDALLSLQAFNERVGLVAEITAPTSRGSSRP